VTDRSTLQDHNDDLLKEVSRLYDRIHSLEAQLNRANQRAQYWAIMFDALNDDYDNRIKAIKRSK
jgi:vacuolar-type H+-ATPase subunit D/Vma8